MTGYASPGVLPPEQEPRPGWGQSLSGGAGFALLHIAYAHAGSGDWSTAHQWIRAATRHPVAAGTDASLYQGAPAVAYVLRTSARPSYAKALDRLDQHVAEITRARLSRAHERIDRGELPALREFDLINGLTGLGVALLHALPEDPHDQHTDLLRGVLAYLVRLAATITVDGTELPGWWTLSGPSGQSDPQWPDGHANLSLAHGISGPLAMLSCAAIRDITVPGQAEAIDRIDRFLEHWRCGPARQPWWPGMISAREWATATIQQPGPQRPSWCYGTPGTARARQLAALALDTPQRRYRAESALAACITDDAQLGQLRDNSLCHGWAGVIHTARRLVTDALPGDHLVDILPDLECRWRRYWRQAAPEVSGPDGMLGSDAGVALASLTETTATSWDACLLTTVPAGPATTTAHTEGT